MRNAVLGGMIAAAAFSIAGFSVAEVREYLQVVRNRTSTSIRNVLPLSVEIDRMEVLIGRLDEQVARQKYAVAQSKIALQDAEAERVRSRSRCETLLAEMQHLRSWGVADHASTGCHTVSYRTISMTNVRRALSKKLSAYQEAESLCNAHTESLQRQRDANVHLQNQFETWQSQRQLLAQRLATIKTRYLAQQFTAETETNAFNDTELARATELADQIERELRIVEAQQALGNSLDVLPLGGSPDEASTVEAKVDQLLSSRGL